MNITAILTHDNDIKTAMAMFRPELLLIQWKLGIARRKIILNLIPNNKRVIRRLITHFIDTALDFTIRTILLGWLDIDQ